MKEQLEKYGKVETCEPINANQFHIHITDGFDINGKNTFHLLEEIQRLLNNKYPIVKKLMTDENHFELILSK